jgi:hypothetical protein
MADRQCPETEGRADKGTRANRQDWLFAVGVTVAFIAAGVFLVSRHEMWRDELNPWMIARYSSTIPELLHNMRYEGHPVLWYIVLWLTTRVSITPEAAQYVHLALAAASVWLFVRYAPLPRLWRLLYAFGFYPFYQYAIVARGYALCTLGLFAFCALFRARGTRLLPLAVILLLLANADVYGWFYAVALTVTLGAVWIEDRRSGNVWKISISESIFSAALVAFGILISPLLTIPPKDCSQFAPWHVGFDPDRISVLIRGMSFSYNIGAEWIYPILNLPIFVVLTLAFLRKRPVAVMWLSLCASLAVFYYVKFDPIYWHKGMVLVYLMAAFWVSTEFRERPLSSAWLDGLSRWSGRRSGTLMLLVLLFFIVYGAKWVIDDIRRPYSAAKYAAEYIRSHSLADRVIVGDWDYSASSVSAYLDRPLYYPAAKNKLGRYLIWNRDRHWPTTRDELCASVAALAPKARSEMVLLLTYELRGRDYGGYPTRLVKRFSGSVKADEDFWIYLVDTRRGPQAP